jgi:hypothetical protein
MSRFVFAAKVSEPIPSVACANPWVADWRRTLRNPGKKRYEPAGDSGAMGLAAPRRKKGVPSLRSRRARAARG